MIEPIYKTIGKRIAKARDAKTLTQTELGAAVGLKTSYISLVEAGKRRITVHVLLLIAKVLDVPVESLVR